ncbi:MAG: hypothetical protein M5U34_42340 [Chloroflexi bacterium]|nr:hypothetical protein [Chloroflexota bacterium]
MANLISIQSVPITAVVNHHKQVGYRGDTNVCPNVEITGAWTGDGDWNPKSTFDPDDSIQWGLTVVNTTGADADIELSYDAYGPNGEHILDWTGMVTVSNGGWNIALRGTVPNGMGRNSCL